MDPGNSASHTPAFSWYRNPETGEYGERLLNPFELADRLRRCGFRVSVQHAFAKCPLRLFNRTGLRTVQKALFHLKPAFVPAAQKVAGGAA
jgi:hypothetical protein